MQTIDQLRSGTSPADQQLKQLLPYVHQLESCPVRMDSGFSFLLQRLSVLYYSKQDYLNASNYTVRAIRVLEEKCPGTPTTTFYTIRWYNYLRLFYDNLGRKKDMLTAIDSCVSIAVRYNRVDYNVIRNLWEKINYYYDIGDYERCLKNAQFGETLTRNYLSGADSVSFALSFCGQAINGLIAMGRDNEVETLLKNRIQDFTRADNQAALGMLNNQLSYIYAKRHDSRQALEKLRQSYACNSRIAYDLGIAQALDNIGTIYLEELNDYRQALQYFRKALAQLPATRTPGSAEAMEALCYYDDIATAYLMQNKIDSAQYYVRLGFDQIAPGTQETDLLKESANALYATQRANYVTELIIHKADICYRRYLNTKDSSTLDQSLRIYTEADAFLDKLRTGQTEIISKLSFRKNARNLYEHAIRAALTRQNPAAAFYFFERSRSVLLNDQLEEQALLDDRDLSKRAAIRKKIVQLQKTMEEMPPDAAAYAKRQTDLYTAAQELERLDKTLHPDQTANGLHRPAIPTLDQLRQYLQGRHQSFLEIYAGDSAVYVLQIDADKARLHQLDKTAYDSLSTAFIGYVSNPERLNRNMTGFVAVSNSLYHLLFPEEPPAGERIVISPDGRYFPFEALVVDKDIRNPGYFLYTHPTSYTYSAHYTLNSGHNRIQGKASANGTAGNDDASAGYGESASAKDLLGIAPVQYAAYLSLPDLPGSNESLTQIGSLFNGGDKFLSAKVSKEYFLQHFSQYRMIQLYTHAIGSQAGKDPKIYFADSALSLSELIPATHPATQLVVLSACETANGAFYQGEGVFSFNREFAALGIPSAIVNCWSVDNQATYKLTELFYQYLAAGDSTDIALQKAKKTFLQDASLERKLPYYWAAPILTGQATVLMHKSSRPSWTIDLIIVALVLTAIFLVGRSFRKRKQTPAPKI